MKLRNPFIVMSLAAGLVSLFANPAAAQLVTGWGLDTGFQNGTVTEGMPGSFSVAPTGGAGSRAVLATPLSLGTVGDVVQLSGTVTFTAGTFGNQQFRFGLFNNNGHTLGTLSSGLWGGGADPSGWLGYIVEPGNANGSGTTALYGRNGSGANSWLSTSGAAYVINNTKTSTGSYTTVPGTFTFDLTLTRLSATSVAIGYALIETDGVGTLSDTGSFTDNSGLSTALSSINAVGFYTPSAAYAASFTGVTVTVPEPSTIALAGLGLAGLLVGHRRSKRA